MASVAAFGAVPRDHAARRDVVDPLGDEFHVVAEQRLVEVAAHQGALAAERIVRSELGLELLVGDPVVEVAARDRLEPGRGVAVGPEGNGVLVAPEDLLAVLGHGLGVAGEALLLLVAEHDVLAGQDPLGRALVHVDLRADLRQFGHDLRRAGPGADHRHPPARQVVPVLPARRVEGRAAKRVQPLDLGQRRRGEGADGAHQDVGLVEPACVVGHHPTAAPLVPAGRLDAHARAQMGSDGEAIGALLEVAQDLGLRGVRLGPVGLEGEGIGVEMRRHVAGRSGVRVEPPGPAHAVGRLEQNEVAPARLGQRDGQPEATGAGADDGDPPVPDGIAHCRRLGQRRHVGLRRRVHQLDPDPVGVVHHGQADRTHRGHHRLAAQPESGQTGQHGVEVGVEREEEESGHRTGGGVDRRRHAVQLDQFDDARLGPAGVAQKDRPQRCAAAAEELGPGAVEGVVHEDLEAETVAPEGQAGLDVTCPDRCMVHPGHGGLRHERRRLRVCHPPPGTVWPGSERKGRAMSDETGPVALVVGGASGIGAALVDAYRATGTTVVVWDVAGDARRHLRRGGPGRDRRRGRRDPATLGRPGPGHGHGGSRPRRTADRDRARGVRPGAARQHPRAAALHAGLGPGHARRAARRLLRGRLEHQRPPGRPLHGRLLRVESGAEHAGPGGGGRVGRRRAAGQRGGARA